MKPYIKYIVILFIMILVGIIAVDCQRHKVIQEKNAIYEEWKKENPTEPETIPACYMMD